jgi:hypothetical protein
MIKKGALVDKTKNQASRRAAGGLLGCAGTKN